MTSNVTQDAIQLRGAIPLNTRPKRGAALLPPIVQDGTGSQTVFTLPQGQKPYAVFNGGSLQVEGASDDYVAAFDGFIWTVTFAVAPANGSSVAIWPTEV